MTANKTRIIMSVLILIIILTVLPILSSVLRQFLEDYRFNLSHVPQNFIIKTATSSKTYFNFFTKVNPINILGWGIIGLFLSYSLFGMLEPKLQKRYMQKDDYGSHGTSRFQTSSEVKKHYFKDNLGWFLGSNVANLKYFIGIPGAYHSIGSNLNMQTLVLGSPGSFKTTSFVLPNVFHIPYMYKNLDEKGDLIITDPKSEIYCLTSKYLENCGYDVYVLDFINLKYGDSLNPINYISSEKELMEIAEGFISSVADTTILSYSSDTFWEESEGQLLGALIGFVKEIYPERQQTFGQVLKILTSDNVRNPKKALNFFKQYNISGTPLQLWNNFLLAEDKVRANILIGLATKLKLFSIKGIKDITGSTTIDIKKIGAKKEKPIALFILMPDKDRAFSPIINSMVTTILNQLYKTAYEYGSTLYSPTFLILEEMANIGRIPNIKVMLGTMRSRRIYPMLIWQSLPQMKNRYKDCWEDILSMCDTHLYLGINDDFTAQYCSRFLGNTTIKIQGTSKNIGSFLENARQSQSQNYYARNLMLPDECKRLCQRKLILNQRSFYPSLLYKVQYKYWEKQNRICDFSNVKDLPEIKSVRV
ncbi:MAG: type IV secretory system conjugative DNA transfer family protein [Actinobacteria bacterium]|nr:type IV secretory system conjugative DNA transfer family protein [Actinomycetota bacterium]